jgi:signal transduction histidine kinase
MSWRIRSIRKRILLLALVPMLSLFGLYVFATGITGRDAINLARARTLKTAASAPVSNFLGQIDTERLYAALYLSAPTPANRSKLLTEEARTGQVTAALHAALTAGEVRKNSTAGERQAISTLLAGAATLPHLHSQLTALTIRRPQALAAYGAVIGDAYQLLNQVILQETSAPIVAQALALVRMGKAEEVLQQENVIVLGDLAARSFPPGDLAQFTELAGARQALYSQTMADLDPAYQGYYAKDVSPQALAALSSLEKAVTGTHPGALPPVRPIPWERTVQGVALGLEHAGAQASASLDRLAVDNARTTDMRLLLSGGIGLLAVIASILVSVLLGRGLVRELSGLRRSALELANERLPEVMERLAAGYDVAPPGEPPGAAAKSDEIGQVADAFAKVQRTAVEAAVGQARLREGISEVFRNLARRSQSLLHRQLALLDAMERRAKDPQELDDLFRIDHLTTRMRRHAESLIILSGRSPARGWRNPVPLVDVLRAAVAEVEDYTRVRVISTADAALAGPAVGDVIHMLAELVENATIFSPPNTPVLISGGIVGQGFVVEIEDRGLGLSEERQAEINDRLASPPPFDPADTDQLGLFVAGQLAHRHSIRITMRPNPYGGTTVIVLIPHILVVPEVMAAVDAENRALENPAMGRHSGMDFGELDGDDLTADPVPPAPMAGAGMTSPPLPGPARSAQHPAAPAWFGSSTPMTPDPAITSDPGGTGLPKRVRQASLAPQLRGNVPMPPPPLPNGSMLSAPPPGGEAAGPRSPEQARATMSALQRGWERGRSAWDVPAAGTYAGLDPAAAGVHPAEAGDFGDALSAGPRPDAGAAGDPGAHPHEPASDW